MTNVPPVAPGPSPAPTDRPASLSETTTEVRDAAQRQGERLAAGVRDAAESAREAAAERADETKERAADELSVAAGALRTAAGDLEGHPTQRELFHRAADGLMELSDAIHGRSLGDMANELSRLGRRNPALFLGSAALAGFALARFGRASAGDAAPGASQPPYATPAHSRTQAAPVSTERDFTDV